MKKSRTIPDVHQLSLELTSYPGEFHKLEFSPKDVGAELISILSRGLYTNPLDCIREYIQNSVDARAQNVTLKFTGNSLQIFDDGEGMDLEQLSQARQFGLSRKSIRDNVGFRGIGLYSGFDICQRLRIATKKRGDITTRTLVVEFAEMRTALDEDKSRAPGEPRTSLIELLTDHCYFKQETALFPVERQFTQVLLEDIADVHLPNMKDRGRLRSYLLRNVPLDFSDDFEHKIAINRQLSSNVEGYHPIIVKLQSDGLEDEIVHKPAVPGLQAPTFGVLGTAAYPRLAFYWSCLNSRPQHVAANLAKALPDAESLVDGFIFKTKGFSVGDRRRLESVFKKSILYKWYMGEIYIVANDIIPNTERNDFEMNNAKNLLDWSVGKEMTEVLEPAALRFQEQGRAEDQIMKMATELEGIERIILDGSTENAFRVYSRLDEILKVLNQHKGKARTDDKRVAEDLISRAKAMQKQLDKEANKPETEAKKQKRRNNAKEADKTTASNSAQEQATESSEPPHVATSLREVLALAGWSVEGDCARLVDMLDAGFVEILGLSSSSYRALLDYVEGSLSGEFVEP